MSEPAGVIRAFSLLLWLVIGVAGLAGSISAAAPRDAGIIAAVFPPWWSASRALAAADGVGDVLNGGTYRFVLIVQSRGPGLGARLRAAGALFLLNPLAVGGCRPAVTRDQKNA